MTLQLIMSKESITVEGCNMIASGSYGPHRSSCASCSNGAAIRGLKTTNGLKGTSVRVPKPPPYHGAGQKQWERSKSHTALTPKSETDRLTRAVGENV